MPEIDRNQIDSEGRGRSVNRGDVPEALRRRYYLDEEGGPGLGFYVDARIGTAAFRDLGARLVSGRSDPNAIRDMASIAHHRGWTVVIVHGDADFRREVWLATMARGIETRGYQPTDRDRQELERRLDQATRRAQRGPESTGERRRPRGEAATLKVVEAVVRGRVFDQPAQERILSAARHRIAEWIDRGAHLRPVDLTAPTQQHDRARERQRSR